MTEEYLRPTKFIDYTVPAVAEKAQELVSEVDRADTAERARRLFYFVRDNISYKMLLEPLSRKYLRASSTLARGYGFCIAKATLLVAFARAVGIPARLHFADIRNFLISDRVRRGMGTDMFVFHGYSEVLVDGVWLKVTPAFDLALTEDKGFIPVDFDGNSDAVLHETDSLGNPHFEYILDRGTYADVPYTEICTAWMDAYKDGEWANMHIF
jgi:transglutaminase-like putative cysteine protease